MKYLRPLRKYVEPSQPTNLTNLTLKREWNFIITIPGPFRASRLILYSLSRTSIPRNPATFHTPQQVSFSVNGSIFAPLRNTKQHPPEKCPQGRRVTSGLLFSSRRTELRCSGAESDFPGCSPIPLLLGN